MSLPWIELHVSLPRHRKSLQLAMLLDDKKAWAYVAQAWLWCGENCVTGIIKGAMAPKVLEIAAGWEGEPGRFVDAAVEVGFVDRDGDSLVLHGWAERAEAHIAKRERDAERSKMRREKVASRFKSPKPKKEIESPGRPPDVTRTSRGRHADVHRNSNPNPNPNRNPNPEEEEKKQESPPASLSLLGEQADKATADGLTKAFDSLAAPDLPRWREVSDARKKLIRAALKRRPLGEWQEVFARTHLSRFLRGQKPGSDWRCTLDWLLTGDNGTKVLEGRYDDDGPPQTAGPPSEACSAPGCSEPSSARVWDQPRCYLHLDAAAETAGAA